MDAKGQRKITRAACLLIAAVIICGAVALLHGGCGRTDNASSAGADSASADQQVARIEELNELARAENQSARDAVTRADERAERAGAINRRVTEQLEGSKELLGQIRADNQRAKQILDELIAGHQARATQREKN